MAPDPTCSVYLSSLGCRLNEAELLSWQRGFQQAGHRVVPRAHDADVVVLNTCAVTQEAVRKSRRQLRWLQRQAPDARMVLTGCFGTLEPEAAAALAGVDAVIPNGTKDNLVPQVLGLMNAASAPAAHTAPTAPGLVRTHTRAFVKVQDGCRNRCSYCIVTVARGAERSRSVSEIITEIHALQEVGYNEVVLTGVHLGGYGHDLGSSLRDLIDELLSATTVPRIRLGSLEPWDLPEDFFTLWENPRLCPHLHLPLQSGCDATLRRMARRCSTRRYHTLIAEARRQIPGLNVTTDLIVGFPGETLDEFQQTTAFVQQLQFGHIHTFPYSPREGTAAARMKDDVPTAEKRRRANLIRSLSREAKHRQLTTLLGQHVEVLWDKRREIDAEWCDWSGYTPNYHRVHVRTPKALWLRNALERVVVDAVDSDGWLHGQRHV